jgi:uncharacterized protein
VLQLKVFEIFYLDMLRKCMKKQQQFGIVLITIGAGSGRDNAVQGKQTAFPHLAKTGIGIPETRSAGRTDRRRSARQTRTDPSTVRCAAHGPDYASPFALPLQPDNTDWVANCWCEILPIPLKARQFLLEPTDGNQRLGIVHQYVVQHNII